jgi:hypothetical protein
MAMDTNITTTFSSVNRASVSAHVNPKSVAYWVCTGIAAFLVGSGGLAYALQVPDVVQGVVALGFPVYFVVMLGVWKALGSVAILLPRLPLLKEWAYAGITFELMGAATASFATGAEVWHVAAPLSIAGLLAVSWALRPASRRLAGTTLRGVGSPEATAASWLVS